MPKKREVEVRDREGDVAELAVLLDGETLEPLFVGPGVRFRSPLNFVRKLNSSIQNFVSQPENVVLRKGTGSYSTPFRGSLFGETDCDEVASKLVSHEKSIDILWLGSNPNVPNSLSAILKEPHAQDDFGGFVLQTICDKYSSRRFTSDCKMLDDFDPIGNPTGRWKLFNKLLSTIGDINKTAMANFVPWGSGRFDDFVNAMKKSDPALLQRLLDFSYSMLLDIVRELNPKLIVVPLSLGQSKTIKGLRYFIGIGNDVEHIRCSFPGKNDVNFYLDERSSVGARILYAPHPSSFYISNDHAKVVLDMVQQRVGTA